MSSFLICGARAVLRKVVSVVFTYVGHFVVFVRLPRGANTLLMKLHVE